jgi:OmpA-OmpF porin, OOP family
MHMKNLRTVGLKAVTLAFAAIGFTTAAHAAGPSDFYAGGTLGVNVIKARDFDVDKDRDGDGRLSGGLFAGVRLGAVPLGSGLPVYAEFGYQDIARHKLTYKVPGGTSDLNASGHSLYLAGKLDVPLTDNFSLYGKLGVARNTVKGTTPAGQTPINIDGSKTSALFGFGVQYSFDSGVVLRTELTDFGRSSANSRAAGLNFGVAYRF